MPSKKDKTILPVIEAMESEDEDEISDDFLSDEDDDDSSIEDDLANENENDHAEKITATSSELLSSHISGKRRVLDLSSDLSEQDLNSKKSKLSHDALYKIPTNDELRQLKEAETLFHSGIFRMQINEMLKEVRIKEGKRLLMENALHKLKDILMAVPQGKQHELDNQDWYKSKKVKVPIIQKQKCPGINFCFQSPSDVRVVGSFLMETCIKPDVHVDLVLEMPKSCFGSKDELNHRYLRKRAMYLSRVAVHLRKHSDIVKDMRFTYHHGNHFIPILVLNVLDDKKKEFRVHLHAVPEDGPFKLSRFRVTQNNIRKKWFLNTDTIPEDESLHPATPIYNTSILTNLTMQTHTELLLTTQATCKGMKDAVQLLKVWLKQRELNQGTGAFTGFIMSMYIVYLLHARRLNRMMSSYQIMRNTLINLANSDWIATPITLCTGILDEATPTLDDFEQYFGVVFIDSTGYVNLCANMNKDMYSRVRHEAKLSLEFLQGKGSEDFESLFMTPVPFNLKFDSLFHLSNLDILTTSVEKFHLSDSLLDRGGDYVQTCLTIILKTLHQGLGVRVHLIQCQCVKIPEWSVNSKPADIDHCSQLTFGLLLNTDHSTSVLQKGPAADSLEAKDFREFWGDVSELRRFQDGSICEAVVWPHNTISAKRLVCGHIIKHILLRHAGIPKSSIRYIGGQLDKLLRHPELYIEKAVEKTIPYGTGEEQLMAIFSSYDGLCRILRDFNDLPLGIHTIQGTSPAFRFAEVFPAQPCLSCLPYPEPDQDHSIPQMQNVPPWLPTMKVVCFLETSGKWPEDKEAFQRLKTAFHIQVAALLSSSAGLKTRIQVDHIDVFKDGYVFSVYIGCVREIAVNRMQTSSDGTLKLQNTSEALALERELVALPKLTSTLHGVQQSYNTYSSVVRLTKRWISAHLLSDYITEEAIELLVAHLYLHPAPFTVPCSPMVGFLRLLSLVSRFDWKLSPLVINLNGEFTSEDWTEIPSKFTEGRDSLPLMVLCTPYDKGGCQWTQDGPNAQIMQRLVLLASASLDIIQQQLLSHDKTADIKQAFRPPYEPYDMLIHLRVNNVPRFPQSVDFEEKRQEHWSMKQHPEPGPTGKLPVIEFNPPELFLAELRAAYGHLALFFYDRYGGDVIGVLWKPSAFKAHQFKITEMVASMPDPKSQQDTGPMFIPNISALIADVKIMGRSLISAIEQRREQWKV